MRKLRTLETWKRLRRRPIHRRDRRARPTPGHISTILSAIPSWPRSTLARLTERMIDRMDQIDGDPDLEHLSEDWEDGHDREAVD